LVQGSGYSKSEVETNAAALKLETGAVALKLETNTAALKLETETETDVCQEISKQERYLADINRSLSLLNPSTNCIPQSQCCIIWWHF
jgi:hypothetical protein